MLNRTVRWCSTLSLVAAMMGVTAANAQEVRVQKGTEAQAATSAGQHYRAKNVLGSKVQIEGNTMVGTVDDIVFDDNGYVEYLIVLNDNKLVTIPWDAAKFNFEKRIAVVNITPERYKAIPTYTVEQYPVFSAPDYRMQTYKYYGLTPGQERRAIRRGAVVVP